MKIKGLSLTFFLLLGAAGLAWAQEPDPETDEAKLTVVVKDDTTGQPIRNARLTLRFKSSGKGKFKRSKRLSWGAKTNSKGRYQFTYVRKGRIVLMVTAQHYQSFGKEYEVYDDNSVIKVRLKKPQPLL